LELNPLMGLIERYGERTQYVASQIRRLHEIAEEQRWSHDRHVADLQVAVKLCSKQIELIERRGHSASFLKRARKGQRIGERGRHQYAADIPAIDLSVNLHFRESDSHVGRPAIDPVGQHSLAVWHWQLSRRDP
jgi:hypothetical protein